MGALGFVNEDGMPIYYLKESLKKADVIIYYPPERHAFVLGNANNKIQRRRDISKYDDDDEKSRRYMYILYKERK